jgi:hypothetical protein
MFRAMNLLKHELRRDVLSMQKSLPLIVLVVALVLAFENPGTRTRTRRNFALVTRR